jgi:hypothetical protein
MVFSLVNQRSSYTCFNSLQRKQTPRTASDNPQLFAKPSSRVCPTPLGTLNQTGVGVQMARNESQVVPELLPTRHLHVSYPATTSRSPQQSDDPNMRTSDKIRTVFATILGIVSLIGVFPRASAQMIVPADRRLHPPEGFDFSGQWNCEDGVSVAHLEVKNRNRSAGHASLPLPEPWTEIRESQDGFNGKYFVGYDRDKSQFLMIDADDPASISYFTDGWNGKTLLLTSANNKGQLAPPHRIQYDVNDSHRFTVTWESLQGTTWKADPGVKCIKVDRQRSITPPKK